VTSSRQLNAKPTLGPAKSIRNIIWDLTLNAIRRFCGQQAIVNTKARFQTKIACRSSLA